jgi:predicted O-methyltransferase YrrM
VNPRRAAVLGTAIAAVVTVVAAVLDAQDLAVAFLGVAMLCITGYLVLSVRSLAESVATATRAAKRAQREATAAARSDARTARQERKQRTSSRNGAVTRELRDTRRQLRNLARGQVELRNTIHRAPGLTAEMVRAYDRLVAHPHPMPELGGWAATPSTMLWILDHVMSGPVYTVVECGSGTTTVWIATALERRGGQGRVVALESSDHYAALTLAELDRLGLRDRATVLHAPLVDTAMPDESSQPWFDLSGLALPGPIDLLFVDGPPGNVAPEARYPAFPLLADRLAADAVVILDDTGRPAEDAILGRWSHEVHAGRTLEVSRTVDRSTVLVATKV